MCIRTSPSPKKLDAIYSGTKTFLQFPETFWLNTEPIARWVSTQILSVTAIQFGKSLDHSSFLSRSDIMFTTVTARALTVLHKSVFLGSLIAAKITTSSIY
ncbi:hypothetical protein BDW22DRAFT_1362136 [Trametopsis cervina]|nr:hypothetical protein BDW22DRAFT_1362136 [Trametopsis cervina]